MPVRMNLLSKSRGGFLMFRKQLRLYRSLNRGLGTFTRFQDYLCSRRAQAERSVLIQLPNVQVADELRSYLKSSSGSLETLYHYSLPNSKAKGQASADSRSSPISSAQRAAEQHWILAEFSNNEGAFECMNQCRHVEGTVPFRSSMLWFNGNSGRSGTSSLRNVSSKSKSATPQPSELSKVEDGNCSDQLPEIIQGRLNGSGQSPDWKSGKTLSEQIKILQESTQLSELGIRLRFFLSCQLEKSFRSLFPQGCVLPFGSTVSGIGRQSGDLDVVLIFDSREVFPSETQSGSGSSEKLLFQPKLYTGLNSSNSRFQTQRVMEVLADVIQLFVPGCQHVQRILQARVPILRFWSDFTDLQCDLSMTNSSGVHMSELIYLMGQLEPRFPTLLFTIRVWASARKITNPAPGRWPTNFMLGLLLIYFLQRKHFLPTLDILFKHAAPNDKRVTSDGIECTFIRDPELILKHFEPKMGKSKRDSKTEQESLAELLFEFFEFYSQFDFARKGVSLATGSSWGKPDASPLYIQNPLERDLNVARNVSKEEVVRFKNECCSALWKLETSWNDIHKQKTASSTGLTLYDLLLTPGRDSRSSSDAYAQQRLQVKELFTKT